MAARSSTEGAEYRPGPIIVVALWLMAQLRQVGAAPIAGKGKCCRQAGLKLPRCQMQQSMRRAKGEGRFEPPG